MNTSNQRSVPAAISQLRAEIEALPQDSGGKRKGVPEDLKRRVAEAWRESLMPGGEFARAISVSASSVCVWSKQYGKRRRALHKGVAKRPVGFKKISIAAHAQAPVGGFTIEGPQGIRVTGLGSDDVVRLWRALC